MADASISTTRRTVAFVPADGREYPTTPSEYTPLYQLGEGSFGKVYLMQVQRTGELVAIKKVPLDDPDNDDGLEEALEEIALLMRHNSPRLVKMLASFVNRASLWIVMEYLAGNSCHALLKARLFKESEVAAVCKSLVEALDYVHVQAQQIHRDLKGANVLLAEDGRVCLGDFGVGTQLNHYFSHRHTQTGTPYWMAPEVITEQGYDARADIWSLGITAIELAKGAPPHSGFHPMQIIPLIPRAAPPLLNKPDDVARFSSQFRDFVAQCLIKNPSHRPTAAQLREHPFIQNGGTDTDLLPPLIADYRAWKREQDGDQPTPVPEMTTTTMSMTQGLNWSFSTHTHLDSPVATGMSRIDGHSADGDESSEDDSSVEADEELDHALATLRDPMSKPAIEVNEGTARPVPRSRLPSVETDGTVRPARQATNLLQVLPLVNEVNVEAGARSPEAAGQDLVGLLIPVMRKHQQALAGGADGVPSPAAAAALETISSGVESLVQADPAATYDLVVDMVLTLNE